MRTLLSVIAMAVPLLASANASDAGPPRQSDNAACTWETVARKWKVNPYMLYAIAKTESNLNPRAINRSNRNGSEDVGMMQINSFWFRKLATYGITREHLFDPCVSLDVAGWILSQNMERHGNTWTAVGAYNAASADKRIAYAKKVLKNLPRQAYESGNVAE